ncbi:uncharacterized protein LOC111063497 isoform X3 [Nilaparvata lugens]|uniref:uncharacterized protein LOC111063497 isoform X3 n=1 Tax=Nilaparvata lugens TaxID=108931 RepID=UPI00193E6C37|nr:uncharacterized protein LOC111063497 isoform X3 [Nilaparvata lugens]
MRLLGLLVLSVSIAASTLADEDWSWGSSSEKKSPSKDSNTDSSSAHAQLSATVVDDIIDGGRGGRQLEGFDDVYSDPDVQQALSAGNDSQARHYIKERLCGLGLMACDDEIEEKRPHVHPQDLIYAQPVHLKPVGRPITAIPIKGGSPVSGPGYGPPRPVPLPGYGGRPPPPFSSGPSHKPSYYGGGPPPPPYRGGSGPGPVFAGSKPSAVFEPEPDFHYNRPLQGAADEKKVVVVNSQSDKVQHHVHHHFHHDADKNAADASFVPPAAIESPVYPPLGPVSYSPSGASGSLYPSNSIPGSSYAGSYNGVNTGPFYKKELNLKGGYSTNNYVTQSAASFNNYPKYETPRADGGFGDCICVPYDQCPPHEIARKEDGYFIDPRTVSGATIEALGPDDVVVTDGNGTMTVVSKHSKRDDSEAKSNDDEITKSTENADESGSKAEPETSRRKREAAVDTNESTERKNVKPRQANYGFSRCPATQVCCRRPLQPAHPSQTAPQYRPPQPQPQPGHGVHGGHGQCGHRNTHGINGRIKNPVYVDGDSEFGEYPWQVAILKKDPHESVYVCGGTLIDNAHIITAAHCIKSYAAHDLRVRLGEWDVNHDVEFYPYVERDVLQLFVHPEFYAGTLFNDLAILRLDRPVDFVQSPHISPACLPDPYTDFSGQRCWTTGWGKDAFGDYGKYQNILKEVDVPVVSQQQCQAQLQNTRLGYEFKLHPGFICAGGEEGKDACKGDGGGPMVCERNGIWQVVGVVSWGIGCGQYGVPGVYVRVAQYLDWIRQITNRY